MSTGVHLHGMLSEPRTHCRPPHLRTHLSELTAYLDTNADALPDDGARDRAGRPMSTAVAESAVNQIVAKRLITLANAVLSVEQPQMRWNRDTVQLFFTVRVAVLDDTLEQTFRTWHASFRPLEVPAASCVACTLHSKCMLSTM